MAMLPCMEPFKVNDETSSVHALFRKEKEKREQIGRKRQNVNREHESSFRYLDVGYNVR